MADLILAETTAHRPRNVDWKRAAALLYGDWGTSKAYVIGLAFVAAGFASLPIILAVCAVTGLGRNQLRGHLPVLSRTEAASIPPRDRKDVCSQSSARCFSSPT